MTHIHIANSSDANIRMILPPTSGGVAPIIRTYNVGGLGFPTAMSFDGTHVHLADATDNNVRMILPPASNGRAPTVFTYTVGGLRNPQGMAFDGRYIHIVDGRSNNVRMILPPTTNGQASTVFTYTVGGLGRPTAMSFDGRYIHLVDITDDNVRMILPPTTNGQASTVFTYTVDGLNRPTAMSFDGRYVHLADISDDNVRMILPPASNGQAATVFTYTVGGVNTPQGMAFDSINQSPVFGESSYAFTGVALAVGTVVGTVSATDADDDTLAYSLTGTDADKFDINSNGQITVATALDYETTYNFNVVADDSTDTTNVPVSATTVNEPLVATTIARVSGNNQSAQVESSLANPLIIQVNDQNGDPLSGVNVTFSTTLGTLSTTAETTNANGRAGTRLTLSDTLGTHTVTVSVINLTSITFTVTAFTPPNTAPTFAESSYAFIDVALAVGTVIGTVSAIDADNDTITYSLTGTDADKFDINSNGQITVATALTDLQAYSFNVVANDGTDETSVGVSVTASTEIQTDSFANQALILFEKERNHTTTPVEAGDNDCGTSTAESTIVCDITDKDGNATEFDHIFAKCSGADAYELFMDGVSQGTRTIPVSIQIPGAEPPIADVSIIRGGWKHDLLALNASLTGASISLTFTGTNTKINEVLILKKGGVINQNYMNLEHSKIDISSELQESDSGQVNRGIIVGTDRLRWMSACALEFTFEDDNYEVFLDWIEDNPAPVIAQDPEIYPWRVYKAVFPNLQHNAPYISSMRDIGNIVQFKLLENRIIGDPVDPKSTFNNEDSQDKYLFFNDCIHLNNDRVVKTNDNIDYNASDNDFTTYSEETTLQFDISRGSDATKATHVLLKATGITSYQVRTLVSNTWTTQETITPTEKSYRGWNNSLEKLTTAITATSIRLVFTGSNIKISEVMILEHAGGLVSLTNILPIKRDRTGIIQQTQAGEVKRVKTEVSSRFKWQLDFSAAFGYNNTHKLEDFLDWINSNPNFIFAERPNSYPWRVYPATFSNNEFNTSFITKTIQIGELVNCKLSER